MERKRGNVHHLYLSRTKLNDMQSKERGQKLKGGVRKKARAPGAGTS